VHARHWCCVADVAAVALRKGVDSFVQSRRSSEAKLAERIERSNNAHVMAKAQEQRLKAK
jgi:hypothetical protein